MKQNIPNDNLFIYEANRRSRVESWNYYCAGLPVFFKIQKSDDMNVGLILSTQMNIYKKVTIINVCVKFLVMFLILNHFSSQPKVMFR